MCTLLCRKLEKSYADDIRYVGPCFSLLMGEERLRCNVKECVFTHNEGRNREKKAVIHVESDLVGKQLSLTDSPTIWFKLERR